MEGNKYRFPVYKRNHSHTATAAVTTVQTITAEQNRGPVAWIDFVINNSTIAQLAQLHFTLSADGDTIVNNEPAVKYSTLYQDKRTRVPVFGVEGGSVIEVRWTNNNGATDIDVETELTYVQNDVPHWVMEAAGS